MLSGESGKFMFTTVRPTPYTVPDNGPVGEILRLMGRHPWRPAHIHFMITADDYKTLVTEIYPADDPYIGEDAVLGVRDSLCTDFKLNEDKNAAMTHGISSPFYDVRYDFVLQSDE